MSIFTEDGVFRVYSGGELVGNREGSEERYIEFSERAERRIQSHAGQSRHYITNIVIDKPEDNYIEGKVMAFVTNKGPEDSAPTFTNGGYYEFKFTYVNSAWKISSLELHYD